MPRHKKDSKALNVMLDSKLYDKLEAISKKEKRTKTAIVELALEEYLNKNSK
ncbi:MAG: ribbon-helix-helix protein, CopG family [Faecalicoccus sp.]|uniref:ribbon-helix-helix protein, CopG family n=1 Tax=Faecalicoccus sp. TaxID=1971758 RepID=UPI002A7EFD69|nr:ribbon-helix-helix protein, CopG family [Faecalicoccus sp.]MDY4279277.1 ribbon-helix-helix protein, CopG family [Faecalicoccus sp.]